MSYFDLPDHLRTVLQMDRRPDDVFPELLPMLGTMLQCDRCFLYLRHPRSRWGRTAYCWRRSENYPDVTDAAWQPEKPEELEEQDPLFAASLRGDSSIFIDDVEAADPSVVNLDYERQHFGHRALIHAHLYRQEEEPGLWGILQPCVFDQPRHWTQYDRSVVYFIVEQITSFAVEYVENHCPVKTV
jgi:GAF domain-containing protein